MNDAVDELDRAEKALVSAKANLADLEKLRNELSSKATTAKRQHAAHVRECSDLALRVARGALPYLLREAEDRRDHAAKEIATAEAPAEALTREIAAAEFAESKAKEALKRAVSDAAESLTGRLRDQTREAFRTAYTLYRRYCEVRETVSAGSIERYDTCKLGVMGSAESLPKVAEACRVDGTNFLPIRPVNALSISELRAALA